MECIDLLRLTYLTAVLMIGDDLSDLDKMQGPWKVATFTVNGAYTSGDGRGEFRVERNAVTLVQPNGLENRGTISLAPKKTPKEFDMKLEKLKNGVEPPALCGIYEIEGNELRMCFTWADPGSANRVQARKGDKCRITIYRHPK